MERMVVVTTDKDRRGVFCGEFVSQDKDIVKLKNVRMAVYWSSTTRGVLGLASIGPQEGSRITHAIPYIELNGVTAVMDATNKAVKQWEAEPWS